MAIDEANKPWYRVCAENVFGIDARSLAAFRWTIAVLLLVDLYVPSQRWSISKRIKASGLDSSTETSCISTSARWPIRLFPNSPSPIGQSIWLMAISVSAGHVWHPSRCGSASRHWIPDSIDDVCELAAADLDACAQSHDSQQ